MIFEEFKQDISKQVNYYNEVADRSGKILKRTFPLQRMMKHLCKINRWLQVERRMLQDQAKDLEVQIQMIQDEILKIGLKFIIVNYDVAL